MEKFKLEFRNGVLIFLLIGVYFLIIDAIGWSDVIALRFANVLFVVYGVNRVIKIKVDQGNNNYLSNFGSAILTSFIAVFLSVLGLALYIVLFKGQDYIGELAGSVLMGGEAVALHHFSFAMLLEGLSSSVVVAFILMQKWKNVKVTDVSHKIKKEKLSEA